MKTRIAGPEVIIILLLPLLLAATPDEGKKRKPPPARENPVAVVKTSLGTFRLELWPKAAPKTVKNFLDLAEGRREFKDVKTGEMVKRPFYDGLTFHRVIKNFMIQGGCPKGDGTGDPGYTFEDEINAKGLGLDKLKAMQKNGAPHPWLVIRTRNDFRRWITGPIFKQLGITSQEELDKKLDEVKKRVNALTLMDVYENAGYRYDETLEPARPVKGVIAMANSGPNTNGSQFFVDLVDTPWLTGKHTVFGKVVEGFEVVEKIGDVKVGPGARPVTPVKILSIREEKPAKKAAPEGPKKPETPRKKG